MKIIIGLSCTVSRDCSYGLMQIDGNLFKIDLMIEPILVE